MQDEDAGAQGDAVYWSRWWEAVREAEAGGGIRETPRSRYSDCTLCTNIGTGCFN